MPKGVKKRVKKFRSNLNNRANIVKKSNKKKKESHSTVKAIKEAWDASKTARENMSAMGIAVNPNEVVPLVQPHRKIVDMIPLEDVPQIQKAVDSVSSQKYKKKANPKAAEVLSSLEADAAKEQEKFKSQDRKFRLPDRDVELVIYLLERYEDDYKAMARDPKNLFQHTPKQIQRMIKVYKDSPMYKAIENK